jgi:molybdenum cofactor cytidylyltransferase
MSALNHDVSMWAIIPAAGLGRRMGRAKQALPYGDSTLTGTVAGCILNAGVDGVAIVTRAALIRDLDLPDDARIQIALNEDTESDMIDSIRIGLTTIADATTTRKCNESMTLSVGVLVVPGDMPTLSAKTCRDCMQAFEADPSRIVIATHGQRRGHPIVFPFALRSAVDQLTGGLNELPRQHADRVHLVEITDPAVTQDVNTPEEYEDLLSQDSRDKTLPEDAA